MIDLRTRIAGLSPAKRALLERRLRDSAAAPRRHAISRRAGAAHAPLSHAQLRLWFLDQLQPGNATYNIPGALRLRGVLNVVALDRSLQELVGRHEVLRTTFATVNGQPQPVVHDPDGFRLQVADLRSLPEAERDPAARRLAQESSDRPFDLSRDLLLRAQLIRISDQEQWLVLTMHHIAADGWSLEVFERELTALYEAYSAGRPSPLPELPIQYADYAVWQRKWLQEEVLQRQLAYWRERLEGAPAVLELTTDFPRPASRSFCGASRELVLDANLTAALRELSRKENATLFMTLLAAWQILLSRYSGQEDVSVGAPIAGRNREELERLIGFFVNTLVLRTDLSGDPTFRELLGRVREVALGAYAHQDLPFERLVAELQPDRNLSHSPVFQVMFALQNAPRSSWELDGLTVEQLSVENSRAKFDLTLSLAEQNGRLQGTLEYNTDLFEEATIDRLLGHFQVLLAGIVVDPEQPIGKLPLLSDAERRQLLVEWNDTRLDYPRDSCVHELFESQVERTPDAIAIVDGDRQISYSELNCRANQLAHYLRRLGVRAQTQVALCLDRSADLVIGIMGILKAGGTYVPLDPLFPRERLRYLLEDSQAVVLLTQSTFQESLPTTEARVTCLDLELSGIRQEPVVNLQCETTAESLAYVIYTSGSTGQPKGVLVPHRGIVRLVCGATYVPFTQPQRILLLASPAFDASTFELWGALLHGSTCVVYSPRVPDFDELQETLREKRITCLWLTSSLFNSIVDDRPEMLASVSHLMIGGEALSVEHVRKFRQRSPALHLVNGYGPTECTTFASTFPIPAEIVPGLSSIPIGRPITNTRAYVLDRVQQPVPVGVAGELYLGGDGLACGYLNQEELTQEKFVADPWGEPGSRLYRTGDRVRWRADGNLEFLGRMDEQVKLRGFRIELGEIEATLRARPQVRQAIVLLREDHPGDKRLVAYVVPQQTHTPPTTFELRCCLQEQLPEHMIPAAFVVLNELPLTPNGKVDRRALPAPDSNSHELASNFVAPRTPLEELLAGIWCDVLRLERVGTHDNFFDLGGHSLLATQLVSRVRSALEIELPIRALFEAPTVVDLGRRIELAQSSQTALHSSAPLRRVARDEPLPLSFAQERLWFIEQFEPGLAVYNIPWGMRLCGRLDVEALERSLRELFRRHEVLRTTFATVNGQPQPTVLGEEKFRLVRADLRSHPQEEREAEATRLAHEAAHRPFDLSRDLMLRAQLLQLDDQEQWLLLTMHHIASDGWSLGVLAQELTALYEAYSAGGSSPLPELRLPELPVQYADYAVWQRQWLQGTVLEQQLAYWRKQLAGAPAVLEFPTDFPRPAVQSFRGASQELVLDANLTAALQELSSRENATLFMTLLAAWQILLSRYSGQEDLSVGAPIAGRNRTELEGLIGFFVNTLVLRTDLSGNPTFRELLARVREVTLGAYAHQDLPFEKLVEELKPERSLSLSPLFQVMFALQNSSLSGLALGDVAVQRLPLDNVTAKFDLTLSLQEGSDGLTGTLQYKTDLYRPETIARLFGHFQVLLKGIVANPDQRIGELPLLTDAERQQLLVEWNDTDTDDTRAPCVHELFEEQVETTPDAVAVIFEDRQLTYRELNSQANRLAHRLIDAGVGPENLVGVCLDRSPEMIVALLGILKAGGAYVPLDPAYPAERLQYLLEDSRPTVLVTQSSLIPVLPTLAACVLCLDAEDLLAHDAVNLAPRSAVDNLAYVIYTSGSTGKPKGVQIVHGALGNFLKSMQAQPGLSKDDVLLALTTYSFDIAALELFLPLTVGARVVLVSRQVAADGNLLQAALSSSSATKVQATPATWQMLLESGWQGDQRLVLLCGGEALSRKLANSLQQCGRELWNLYGPTETTIWSTLSRVGPGTGPIHIGRPIANTQVYVLDRHRQPTPVGVAGDLYIGGKGVARGYLNRPDLTAEKFVADCFSNRPGDRLYRTGDLVRWRADGNLEWLGRTDQQVKLRGFRIELGEIETALGRHPQVRQAVVLLREDQPGDKRLVAYVVPQQTHSPPTATDLRCRLQVQLPEYMIPAAFVVLNELPLTPNGKVDRQALPAPDNSSRQQASGFVAPRTPLEELLAGIWCDVLQLERVGIHDNFFDLGGHSLLAVRLFAQIAKAVGCALPLATLFEKPTIAGLALAIQQPVESRPGPRLVAIQPHGSKPPVFWVPGGGGLSTLPFREVSSHFAADQPVYGLEADPVLANAPHDVRQMAEQYLELIRKIQPEGPYHLLGFCAGSWVTFEMAVQLGESGQKVGLLVVFDTACHIGAPVSWAGRVRMWGQRLNYHLRQLRQVGWRDVGTFFKKRLVHATLFWLVRLRWGWARLTVPQERSDAENRLRQNDSDKWNRVAIMRYSAAASRQKFCGHITVILPQQSSLSAVSAELDPRRGWRNLSTGGIEVHQMPGTHRTMLKNPHAMQLAGILSDCLDRAQAIPAVPDQPAECVTVESPVCGVAARNARRLPGLQRQIT